MSCQSLVPLRHKHDLCTVTTPGHLHSLTVGKILWFCAMLQAVVQLACLHSFLEAPRLQLRYTCGTRQVVHELALPVAPHKFMVPEPHISKEMFFEKWKAYQGPPISNHDSRWTAMHLSSMIDDRHFHCHTSDVCIG